MAEYEFPTKEERIPWKWLALFALILWVVVYYLA
jgi:uncharacterized membrane protein